LQLSLFARVEANDAIQLAEETMKRLTRNFSIFMTVVALAIVVLMSAQLHAQTAVLGDQVRRELNKLPFITAFDYDDFEVTGDTVRLTGAVTKPWDKTDAEALVKKSPAVATIVNDIEVLPLSRFDDAVRVNAYRALFNFNSTLYRYRVGANAPIRIIVRNGHLTLEGFVNREMDRQIAESLARQVPNTFSVTNKLKIG
jgi:hyperosmotically inducible periplasmic protein